MSITLKGITSQDVKIGSILECGKRSSVVIGIETDGIYTKYITKGIRPDGTLTPKTCSFYGSSIELYKIIGEREVTK